MATTMATPGHGKDKASLAPQQTASRADAGSDIPAVVGITAPVRPRAPSPLPPESAFKLAQALAEMRRSPEEQERKSYV